MRLCIALFTVAALLAPARAADDDDALPRYVIERIEVRGNKRTAGVVIKTALFVRAGESIAAGDPRMAASRWRLIGTGLFSEARLRLERGSQRGMAILIVDVTERGTLVLNQIWWGASRAVAGWGGVDIAETNVGGVGLTLGGAALVTAAPEMPGGAIQMAFRLRTAARIGRSPFTVGATLLYNDASEPFRVVGDDSDGSPSNFRAVRYQRGGGTIGLGVELGGFSRLRVDYRIERIDTTLPRPFVREFPDGTERAINPFLLDGASYLSSVAFGFERDTRADPVLTRAGSRLVVFNEFSTRALGASYDYYKLTVGFQQWIRLRWGHVFSVGTLAGVIIGDAPIFERYYLGDIDPLVPPRALGLSLSTLPARNLLGAGMTRTRTAPLMGRLMLEYAIPLFRGGRHVYGGDIYFDLGLVGMAELDELRVSHGWDQTSLDLLIDAGVRLDTVLGTFNLSLSNTLSRLPW